MQLELRALQLGLPAASAVWSGATALGATHPGDEANGTSCITLEKGREERLLS